MEYTHAPLGETVEFLSGTYDIESENKLSLGDMEVLYLIGKGGQICGCAGTPGTGVGLPFVTVPGFIREWKSRTNEAGLPVTDIDPVDDEGERAEITRILKEKCLISNIGFW